jgi:uncharacterized protein
LLENTGVYRHNEHLKMDRMSRFSKLLLILQLCSLSPALVCSANPRQTTNYLHAQVQPLALPEVRWTEGFWAERLELCRQSTIPGLWSIMEGTNYSQFYENFRIAAGLSEGRHRGASFNDGDFYKWIEAASASLAATPNPELKKQLDQIINVIARAQEPDGYLHTPIIIKRQHGDTEVKPLQDPLQFELYNMGHLFTAASVHHEVTGQSNLLGVACKAAEFLEKAFAQPSAALAKLAICPSHYTGLLDLYRVTHEVRYLELARKLFDMRAMVQQGTDDNQDRVPFNQQTNAVGHAVRANYLYAGAADLFLETGDRRLFDPVLCIWSNVVHQKLYITGGCGALFDGASPDGAKDQKAITRVHQAYGRNYQLPNTTAHNETCANIGNVLWNWRLFLATGEARFMDVAELALYNSVLSGMSLDGTNFFYVNPLRTSSPLPVDLRWPHHRVAFLSSFCCPPNLARTVAESSRYAYAKSDNTLWINLYGSSRLATELSSAQKLKITQTTDYPWNGRVRIRIDECGSAPLGLNLRIPGWARSGRIRINGRPHEISWRPSSYAQLRQPWHAGDSVDLELDMAPILMEANPLIEETRNQLAVQRGPVIYCLESVDLPKGRVLDAVALPLDADLVARFDARLLGGVVCVETTGVYQQNERWNAGLYRPAQVRPPEKTDLRFIPYFAWGNRGPSEMSVWLPANSPALPKPLTSLK